MTECVNTNCSELNNFITFILSLARGAGLQQTASPPSRNETQSVNPLKIKKRHQGRTYLTKET